MAVVQQPQSRPYGTLVVGLRRIGDKRPLGPRAWRVVAEQVARESRSRIPYRPYRRAR